MCLVGVEKWRSEILFCLVENENERIENGVCINLLLYPYYIKRELIVYKGGKVFFFFLIDIKLELKKKKKKKPMLKRESRWVISHIKPTFFPIYPKFGENTHSSQNVGSRKKLFSPPFSIPGTRHTH